MLHFDVHFVLHVHSAHGINGAVIFTSAWTEPPLFNVTPVKKAVTCSVELRLHELITFATTPVGNRLLTSRPVTFMSVRVSVYSPQHVGGGRVNVIGEVVVEVTVCVSTMPCGVVRVMTTVSLSKRVLTIGREKVVVQFAEEHIGAQSGLHLVRALHLHFASRLPLLLLLLLLLLLESACNIPAVHANTPKNIHNNNLRIAFLVVKVHF